MESKSIDTFVWLPSLRTMSVRASHVLVNISSISDQHSIAWIDRILFIHPAVNGHLACF